MYKLKETFLVFFIFLWLKLPEMVRPHECNHQPFDTRGQTDGKTCLPARFGLRLSLDLPESPAQFRL